MIFETIFQTIHERESSDKYSMATLWDCYILLAKLCDRGYIQRDPQRKNNILVYVPENENQGGWYSQNIIDAAGELFHDVEGQRVLREELESMTDIHFESEDYND